MASAGFSAKNARVYINGTYLSATKWMVSTKTDELDITNFETTAADNVYADYTFGVKEAEVSVEAVWDASHNPHNSPPNIKSGSVLTNVRLYLDATNLSSYWSFPSFQVFTVSTDAEIRGIVKYTFSGKNKGVFTEPT